MRILVILHADQHGHIIKLVICYSLDTYIRYQKLVYNNAQLDSKNAH